MVKQKCDVFFSKFDTDKVNADGWGGKEGKLMLKLTDPLANEKSIDALDESIEKKKFKYIGSIELEKPEQAFGTLQNGFRDHPLKNRSMMIGDVVICGDKGKIVEHGVKWSDLSNSQIQKLSKLKSKK